MADPVRARGAERYFKETIKSYGVAAADVHALAAELYAAIKAALDRPPTPSRSATSSSPTPSSRPRRSAASSWADSRGTSRRPSSARVKGWLAADRLDNWASVDTFCPDAHGRLPRALPGLCRAGSRLGPATPTAGSSGPRSSPSSSWPGSPSSSPAIYEISASVFPVDDDLVQKANGWLLREAGKADAARLERFLLDHGPADPAHDPALRHRALSGRPGGRRSFVETRDSRGGPDGSRSGSRPLVS
ncbi:MAG: DNA alkylation repair protein [Comamonadaceae bacterium]|nr:DNA alkylation repair protein [Comamonadaceae bacterium]